MALLVIETVVVILYRVMNHKGDVIQAQIRAAVKAGRARFSRSSKQLSVDFEVNAGVQVAALPMPTTPVHGHGQETNEGE